MTSEKDEEAFDFFGRLLRQLQQTERDQRGCNINLVYVASGAQHVNTIQNQNNYCSEKKAQGCGLYTKMSDAQKAFLDNIKPMNIEARYQEYKDEVARKLNREAAAEILETTKQIHAWILEKLREKSSTR